MYVPLYLGKPVERKVFEGVGRMPQLKRLTLVNVIPTSILSSLSARNGFLDEIVISVCAQKTVDFGCEMLTS